MCVNYINFRFPIYISSNFRYPFCNDVTSYNSTYTFPPLANAAAVAAAAAAAANTVASVASVSGGTSSVTTGANQTSTGWTSDMPDYSGVDSTTSPDFSRPNDLGSSLGDSDQVNISSGKYKLMVYSQEINNSTIIILVMVFYEASIKVN